jgi:hypothetical protein
VQWLEMDSVPALSGAEQAAWLYRIDLTDAGSESELMRRVAMVLPFSDGHLALDDIVRDCQWSRFDDFLWQGLSVYRSENITIVFYVGSDLETLVYEQLIPAIENGESHEPWVWSIRVVCGPKRPRLIALIKALLYQSGAESEEEAALLNELEFLSPDPAISDLIYYTDEPLTPSEIADRALGYQAIAL